MGIEEKDSDQSSALTLNSKKNFENDASDVVDVCERINSEGSDFLFDLDVIMRDPKAVKKEKFKIKKNLYLICFAFLCNFIAFQGTSSLQSSLNHQDGLGTVCLAILYASLILSAMFTPTIVIKWLGCKWTICVAIVGYVTYSLANFYPNWGTLVPSSIIVGISAAPLWSAKCTYLTTVAKRYAKLTGETTEAIVNRFFGIFFLIFQFNYIIGQLVSSFVLSGGDASNLEFPECYNETYIEKYCGANDCQESFNKARKEYNTSDCIINELQAGKPSQTLLYTLMGIYTGVALFGAGVIALLADPIQTRKSKSHGQIHLLIATFKHMRDYRQILLIVITMYSGFEQAVLIGDITRSFISCPLALNWVGFILICFGACDSVCSFVFGRIEKYTGRPILFTGAFLIHLAIIIVLLTWVPYPSSPVLFFLLPGLWGVSDAVWQTQLNAFYGVIFVANQEASFANYRLWQSLGFVIAFAYQNYICVSAKLYVLLSVLIIGMILYYFVELDARKRSRNEKIVDTTDTLLQSDNNLGKKDKNSTI